MKIRIRRVEVTWFDSSSIGGWLGVSEVRAWIQNDKRHRCITTGYLVKDGKRHLKVALSMSANGTMAHVMTIPKENITKVARLKDCK